MITKLKKIRMSKTIRPMAAFVVCLASAFSSGARGAEESFVPNFLSLFPGAEQFRHSRQDFDRYDAYLGAIDYIESENMTAQESEGYQPSKSNVVAGVVERYVFDHRREDSAVEVYSSLLKELEEKKFELLFHCEREACGDVAGWQLYLSDYVDGEVDSQYYIIARHAARTDGEWFLALYVNEFSDRPRTLIDIVNTRPQAFDGYEINAQALGHALQSEGEVLLEGVHFSFGKADLTPESEPHLQSLIDALAQKPDLSVQIVGHTDSIGDDVFNRSLSLARAEAVQAYLLEKEPSLTGRVDAVGLGAAQPVTPNDTADGRAKNRRVTVIARQQQE